MHARASAPFVPSGLLLDVQSGGEEEEIAELWASLCSAQDPITLLRETLVRVVAEERERCACVAETDADPDERMPWRYRLRFRLRPETMARTVINGVRRSIAARIRADRAR